MVETHHQYLGWRPTTINKEIKTVSGWVNEVLDSGLKCPLMVTVRSVFYFYPPSYLLMCVRVCVFVSTMSESTDPKNWTTRLGLETRIHQTQESPGLHKNQQL